jgi:hypothetical protein
MFTGIKKGTYKIIGNKWYIAVDCSYRYSEVTLESGKAHGRNSVEENGTFWYVLTGTVKYTGIRKGTSKELCGIKWYILVWLLSQVQ